MESKKCGYCRKEIEGEPVKKTIFGRWNGEVTQTGQEFCSEEHASYQQMSLEG